MIGILLAGGSARRLGGGDKGRYRIGDATILQHIVRRFSPQCDAMVLSANGDPGRFAEFGLPVVADDAPGGQGPLAGLLTCLDHVASNYRDVRFVVTVTTDTPFLPIDLVARLTDAQVAEHDLIVCARSQGRVHPLTALWSLSLRDDLRRALHDDCLSKVSGFVARHAFSYVDWPAIHYDPFFNVNTEADLAEARRLYATLH